MVLLHMRQIWCISIRVKVAPPLGIVMAFASRNVILLLMKASAKDVNEASNEGRFRSYGSFGIVGIVKGPAVNGYCSWGASIHG